MRFRAAFFFFLGATFFTILPFFYLIEKNSFQKQEPYYGNPVGRLLEPITIRQDSYGKGYFGASRNGSRVHKGIDVACSIGEAILASKSGRVSVADVDKGYGNWIEIAHPDGLSSRYAHLSEILVKKGAWVKRGQLIGKAGKTGNAADRRIAPHLHFEIRFGSHALNPFDNLLDPSFKKSSRSQTLP